MGSVEDEDDRRAQHQPLPLISKKKATTTKKTVTMETIQDDEAPDDCVKSECGNGNSGLPPEPEPERFETSNTAFVKSTRSLAKGIVESNGRSSRSRRYKMPSGRQNNDDKATASSNGQGCTQHRQEEGAVEKTTFRSRRQTQIGNNNDDDDNVDDDDDGRDYELIVSDCDGVYDNVTPGAHAVPGPQRGTTEYVSDEDDHDITSRTSQSLTLTTTVRSSDDDVDDVEAAAATPTDDDDNHRNSHSNIDRGDSSELISAIVVDEEWEDARREEEIRARLSQEAVVASVVDNKFEEEQSRNRRRRRMCLTAVAIFVVAAVTLGLTIPIVPNKNNGEDTTPSATPAPLSVEDYLIEILYPVSGDDLFGNEDGKNGSGNNGTAQYQAMQWMLRQDEDGLFPVKSASEDVLKERYALAVLYYATGGPTTWVDQVGYLSELSVCEWPPLNTTGRNELNNVVWCNDEGRVVSVAFHTNNLTGTLPKEIGSLQFVAKLMIQSGALTGTLPSELFQLTLLTSMSFNDNFLSGDLGSSEDWDRLNFLRLLDLGKNLFNSTIPGSITMEEDIESLWLYNNFLYGTIPDFDTRSAMRSLLLFNNELTGDLPESLYTLRQLERMDFYGNYLQGTLSENIGNLGDKLLWIDLSYNDFTGPLPSEIGELTQLQIFDSTWTGFNSTLPSTVGNMNQLQDFKIGRNAISGTIPTELGRLDRTLTSLVLGGNLLTGTIPSELGQLTKLVSLFLVYNELTGTFPIELQSVSTLQYVYVSNNSLTGDMDTAICDLPLVANGAFEADCLASSDLDTPEVTCACCSGCCNDNGDECVPTPVSPIRHCEGLSNQIQNLENATWSCGCEEFLEDFPQDPSGETLLVTMNCNFSDDEDECCIVDGTICGRSKKLGMQYIEDGDVWGSYLYEESTYTSGLNNETILFEYGGKVDNLPTWCRLSIDGQQCASCGYLLCNDNNIAHDIDCTNVLGDNGYYSGCTVEREDLGVFSMLYAYESGVGCSTGFGGL